MKGKKISIFLLYLHIWKIVSSNNEISLNKNLHNPPLRSHHTFAKYWPYLSIIGGFGIFLNIFVLYSFYSERATIFTSVNIMIGYEDIRNSYHFISTFIAWIQCTGWYTVFLQLIGETTSCVLIRIYSIDG